MSNKDLMLIFFIIGVAILTEQYINYGVIWEWTDIHHETIALGFICLGIGVYLGVKK